METHTLKGNNKFITNLKFSSQTQDRKNIKDTYNNTNLINGVLIRQAGGGGGGGGGYILEHLVGGLRYRPEGNSFDSQWGKWDFFVDLSFPSLELWDLLSF